MSIARSQLGRGPAHVTFGGATLFTSADILARHSPAWQPVMTSMYGQVDRVQGDRVIRIPLRLWGAWENLSVIFPSYALAPQAGTSIFGTSDSALVILGRNGDQITYHNARLTRLANLFLGVAENLFAADVEFTALLKNSTNPEDANAYYTVATAQAYADSVFAKTNFKRVRFTGTWGAVTGFTTITPQGGFNISWDLDLQPLVCDGLGTVDMTVGPNILQGTCRCIPIAPTLAQIETATKMQGIALGSLLSTSAADLTLAGSGISVVLKSAGMLEHGYAFGATPLRVGEMAWGTTLGFTTGAPDAVATVS